MDPSLVREWLVVAQRFQAMDTHVRQQEVHIELENRQWTSPFFIELELVMEQLGLLETGLKENMTPDDESGELHVDPIALIASMKEILGMGIRLLQEWLASPSASIGSLEESSYVPIPYFVQSQPVTLRKFLCQHFCLLILSKFLVL